MFDSFRLAEFISSHGLRPHSINSVSWVFQCPKCQKPKLYVRRRDGRFICFRCSSVNGYFGKCEFALSDLTGLTVREIQKEIYGSIWNQSLSEDKRLAGLSDYYEIDDGLFDLPAVELPADFLKIDSPMSALGARYLEGRGIPTWMASEYGLMYSHKAKRVVFPVYQNDRLVGWQGRLVHQPRSWVNTEGKTITQLEKQTSTGLQKDRCLMFQNRMVHEHVVLCEGPVDSIKAHLCGGNVCTMGKAVSDWQMRLIQTAGVKKIYLGLDPDAREDAEKLVARWADVFDFYWMKIEGKDLGEMDFKSVLQSFRTAYMKRGMTMSFLS